MEPLRSRRPAEPAIATTTNSVGFHPKAESDYAAAHEGLTNRHKASLSEGGGGGGTGRGKQAETFWTKVGGGLELSKGENRVLAGLVLLAGVVRLWMIGRPSSVV